MFNINVVLADDHPGMLAGVTHELSSVTTIVLKGQARNSTELMELLQSTPCDVLVSDYAMPAGDYGDGIALFELIGRRFPHIKLVVLTMLDTPAILLALDALGVRAVVSKSDAVSHLVPAIHAAYTGGTYHSPSVVNVLKAREEQPATVELTKREAEVVRLFVSGLRVDDIAAQVRRSKKTISTQKARAMEKLGLTSDVELVKYGLEHGWLAASQAASDSAG